MNKDQLEERTAELVQEWFDWLQDEARYAALEEAGLAEEDMATMAAAIEGMPRHLQMLEEVAERQYYLRGYEQALMDARLSIDAEALKDLRTHAAAELADWAEFESGDPGERPPEYNMESAPGQRRRYAVADLTSRRMGGPTRSPQEGRRWLEQCQLARPEHCFVLASYEGPEDS